MYELSKIYINVGIGSEKTDLGLWEPGTGI